MISHAGLYIHIPFCIRKCPYCDFYSTNELDLIHRFADALQKELRMRASDELLFDTIYFGGGTPSVMTLGTIGDILQTAYKSYLISDNVEITIEVNPGTVDFEKLRAYRDIGINRINIGVQSFQDEFLRFLGRIHSAKDAELAIRGTQKAGFENIGMDLIYGIPGQTEREWMEILNTAISFAPAHLSCYMLTYESGTQLDRQRQAGIFTPAEEETVGHLFLETSQYLASIGYVHYEISNFAQTEAMMSRHNRKYWNFMPYFGFGPSAHSFASDKRFWNFRSITRYIESIEAGTLPVESSETLSREAMMIEMVYLGLRQSQGIDRIDFEKKFGISFEKMFGNRLKILERKGLIELTEKFCTLTTKGIVFADGVTRFLI